MRKIILFLITILSAKVSYAQYHITSNKVYNHCTYQEFKIQTNVPIYGHDFNLTIYYGDGSTETKIVDTSSYSSTIFDHSYNSSGEYRVKAVLIELPNTHVDSAYLNDEYVLCSNIPLKFYYDQNGNCVKENNEKLLINPAKVEVDSNGKAIDTISFTSGIYYQANGHTGDVYSFKILSLPGDMRVLCPSTGIIYDTLQSALYYGPTKYVGLVCGSGTKFDLSVHPVIPVSGLHDEWGNIYINNKFCAPVSGTLTLTHSSKYNFGYGMPKPDNISGNSVIWNLANIGMSNLTDIYYVLIGGGHLKDQDTVHSYVTLDPVIGDSDPTNNAVEVVDTVNASSDPNEMFVSPGSNVLAGAELQYTINFENVGRDTAFNIHVMDTLSDYLDARSLEVVAASGEMNISRIHDNVYHYIYKFDFPAINLLDSSHHGQCDGIVIFNIKTKAGLANGTKIFNRAGVYFDNNDVVMTNTVENIIGWPDEVHALSSLAEKITVWPNPAKNSLQLSISNWQSSEKYNYVITDMIGRLLRQGSVQSTTTQIDINSLSQGIYFIKMNGYVKQFVKE